MNESKYIDKALVLMAVDAIPKDTITELTINADVIEKIPDAPKDHREFEQGRGRTMIIRWQAPAKKIEFSRQEFVIMLDNQPHRIVWSEGAWFTQCVDEGLKRPAPLLRIDTAIGLALLNLPVFDLVKEDGTVVEDR